jgi:hypothetical protein
MYRFTFVTLPMLALLAAIAPTSAQELVGTAIDDLTGDPVPGVEVVLRDGGGDPVARAVADARGNFAMAVPGAGTFTLRVSGLGYQAFSSDPIQIGASTHLTVEIRLGIEAVPLEPIVVTTRSRRMAPDIEAFYARLERGRRMGQGHFISRADIEAAHAARTTDLLRTVSGVQVSHTRTGRGDVVRMRGGCIPAIYIDGTHMNRTDARHSVDEYVQPASLEGIEVYRGAGRSVGHYYDPRGCGLVLVWTQRGELGATTAMRWRTIGVVFGSLLGLVLLLN